MCHHLPADTHRGVIPGGGRGQAESGDEEAALDARLRLHSGVGGCRRAAAWRKGRLQPG